MTYYLPADEQIYLSVNDIDIFANKRDYVRAIIVTFSSNDQLDRYSLAWDQYDAAK